MAELDGAISKLRYAAFQVIPYLARFLDHIPVTSLLDETELEDLQLHSKGFLAADDLSDGMAFDD